ncbi:MAG: hypothetical protein KC496_17760 [Anaerolineae bacterium]|nr:hypothetical protein [Anaerolineae bacterium]
MLQHKRPYFITIAIALVALVIAACQPEPREAPTAIPPEDQGMPLGNAAPAEGSVFEDVTIWVDAAETTDPAPSAESGSLILTLTVQNTGAEDQTLELARDDYVLLTDDGLQLEPIIISDALVNPEIPAGDSVSGTAEFSTLHAASTYTLNISGFERITVDASLAPIAPDTGSES